MARVTLTERVSELEQMMRLVYAHLDTEMSIQSLKKEMEQWREEMEKDRRDINKRWGELAKKMGTLVKGIIAPAFPDVIKERFNTDILKLVMYATAKHPQDKHKTREFDPIAVCEVSR